MRGTPGISGHIFSALGDNEVNAIAIAQGSSECSISVVVAAGDTATAVAQYSRVDRRSGIRVSRETRSSPRARMNLSGGRHEFLNAVDRDPIGHYNL